jgi:hypothetical protein
MATWIWVGIVVALLLVIGLAIWAAMDRRRSRGLRDQFGPEYDLALRQADDRRAAEAELEARRERRAGISLRPLAPETRSVFLERWRDAQARFVDSPSTALEEADVLVLELLRERGYPSADFEQRAADISVDHPDVIRNYRAAHAVSTEASAGDADTERLRQGLVHFRALFDELLWDDTGSVEAERRAG